MENVSPTRGQQARAAGIAAELASLGLALPGTLIERHVRCGKPGCRCHADPPARHGPYHQHTCKIAGKTVTRRLTTEQADRYREQIANRRTLDRLIVEMEQISTQARELPATEFS